MGLRETERQAHHERIKRETLDIEAFMARHGLEADPAAQFEIRTRFDAFYTAIYEIATGRQPRYRWGGRTDDPRPETP